jgi:hypothetical protein
MCPICCVTFDQAVSCARRRIPKGGSAVCLVPVIRASNCPSRRILFFHTVISCTFPRSTGFLLLLQHPYLPTCCATTSCRVTSPTVWAAVCQPLGKPRLPPALTVPLRGLHSHSLPRRSVRRQMVGLKAEEVEKYMYK